MKLLSLIVAVHSKEVGLKLLHVSSSKIIMFIWWNHGFLLSVNAW